uniref:Complement factor D (adipsin) n=1 Tax=Xenopus tropicalis TaxID=8364 RepID=F6S3Y5_XENTR
MNVSWALLAVVLVLTVATYECRPRGRILGGQDSKAEVRPYMASIQQNGIHQCGGVLIADKWVLSAAHCATNSSYSSLNVMLGAISLSKPEKYKIVVKVLREIPHPLYNSTIKHHDLLLLELSEKVTLSPAVNPLPFQNENIDISAGKRCLVAGWGQMRLTGKKPDTLQELWVPLISRDVCNRRNYYDNEITANMICAGESRKDSCEGDSGGPLVCDGIAVAIVQGGFRKCGNPTKPGIYTLIEPYKSWIMESMYNATLQSNPSPL